MKERIKQLYILQLKHGKIPPEYCDEKWVDKEKRILTEEARKKIKVVLTGGVFDILHIGHIYTLKKAKALGDVLVVVVARDEMIRRKGRAPIHPQEYRKAIVEELKCVDVALAGGEDPQKIVEKVKPDVIVYGYDQKAFLKPEGVEIVKLTEKIDDHTYKSSKIWKKISERFY